MASRVTAAERDLDYVMLRIMADAEAIISAVELGIPLADVLSHHIRKSLGAKLCDVHQPDLFDETKHVPDEQNPDQP